MISRGRLERDSIAIWQAQRKDLLVDAEFATTLAEFEAIIGQYHQLGVKIYRESRARGEEGTLVATLGTEYIIPATTNRSSY